MSSARTSSAASSPARRRRPVSLLDVAASAAAHLAPRGVRPRIDQARLDARSLLDALADRREPTFQGPTTPAWEPTPLSSIDPIEHLTPTRALRERWVTLRTDLRWLARDLRGQRRPPLVTRGPSRYAATAVDRSPSRSLSFRRVRVRRVERQTEDAVTVWLEDPDGAMRFEAGQFLSFRFTVGDRVVRRAYSLSSCPLDGPEASITVKRVPGGLISSWICDELTEGEHLEVLGPSGSFRVDPDLQEGRLVLIAGGSGITPVVSIAETVLRTRPGLRVSLLYGNRAEGDVIFARRLAALAAAHPERLDLTLALERPPEGWSGLRGRLDPARLTPWLDALPQDGSPRRHYLCGPAPMMEAARRCLLARGVPASEILEERFSSPRPSGADPDGELPTEPVTVQLRVAGRDHLVPVAPGQTLLEAGLAAGVPMPFSCAMGGCGACKGRLRSGSVAVEEPSCLSDSEREDGWVLTCSSRPHGRDRGLVQVEVAECRP